MEFGGKTELVYTATFVVESGPIYGRIEGSYPIVVRPAKADSGPKVP